MIATAIEETIFTWALANIPTIASLAGVGWIVWRLRGFISGYNSKLGQVESRLTQVEVRCTRLEKDVKSIKKRLTRVEKKLDTLITFLVTKKEIDPATLQANSPIDLTEVGYKILDEMGGREYIDKRLTKFLAKIDNKKVNSPLELQNYSVVAVFDRINKMDFMGVRDYVFKTSVVQFDETVHVSG